MSKKLTAKELKEIIISEAKKELQAPKAKEVDADKLADTLEKHIDHYAILKLKEAKHLKALKKIREAKARLKKKISR